MSPLLAIFRTLLKGVMLFFYKKLTLSVNNACVGKVGLTILPFVLLVLHLAQDRVTMLINNNIDLVSSSVVATGHLLFAQIKHQNTLYNIYNLLVPQTDNIAIQTLEKLNNHCDQHFSDGVINIVGGDFKCTCDPSMDRADRLTEHRPRVSTALKNVLTNSNLCDVWRRLNPQVKRYTCMRKKTFLSRQHFSG